MDKEKIEFEEIEDQKVVIDDLSSSNDEKQAFVKSEAEKRFVRKLNNNILPLIFFIILCQVITIIT